MSGAPHPNDCNIISEHPTFTGYGTTRLGAVWTRWVKGNRFARKRLSHKWRKKLKPSIGPFGHQRVTLYHNDRRLHVNVSILVCQCFGKEIPDGELVRHWDGDPSNNRISNLIPGTHADNSADAIRHQTTLRGEKHPKATLPDSVAAEIWHRYRKERRQTQRSLGKEYGVAHTTIGDIVRQPVPPGTIPFYRRRKPKCQTRNSRLCRDQTT